MCRPQLCFSLPLGKTVQIQSHNSAQTYAAKSAYSDHAVKQRQIEYGKYLCGKTMFRNAAMCGSFPLRQNIRDCYLC